MTDTTLWAQPTFLTKHLARHDYKKHDRSPLHARQGHDFYAHTLHLRYGRRYVYWPDSVFRRLDRSRP
jgi:hypothetical protein